MMKRILLAACLAVAPISTAHATGTIECVSPLDEGVTVFINIGRLPVLSVIGAEFTAQGRTWSMPQSGATVAPGATPIMFGQGIQQEGRLLADFTDTNIERIVVSLKTVSAFDDKSGAEAGIVTIEDAGIWPVTCESG
jgi:hypothetical protein